MNSTFDHNTIRAKAADVLIKCNVKSFPFDCVEILQRFGYKVYTYEELKEKNEDLYHLCLSYSQDAFRIGSKKIIVYNASQSFRRIRFSLMHELGHHILEHKNDSAQNEAEANFFASNILAPRIAIYYTRLKQIKRIADVFDISYTAASYATKDFIEWCTEVRDCKMHDYDQRLYDQFYNFIHDGFVYSIKTCKRCGISFYNDTQHKCITVYTPSGNRYSSPYSHCGLGLSKEDQLIIRKWENRWLYNV